MRIKTDYGEHTDSVCTVSVHREIAVSGLFSTARSLNSLTVFSSALEW